MQLTQSRKLRQNAGLKIPKILAQRDQAANTTRKRRTRKGGEFLKDNFWRKEALQSPSRGRQIKILVSLNWSERLKSSKVRKDGQCILDLHME